MTAPGLMLLAWAFEAAFGWPDRLYQRIRHPVVWLGSLIAALERGLNKPSWPHRLRYGVGAAATFLVVMVATGVAIMVSALLPASWWGVLIEAVIASSLIASCSLYQHVAAVAQPLAGGDLERARKAVAMIVGRDPTRLDEAGIARAGLESLAENASDGVVAPLCWGAVLGLPGVVAYKAVNTLDSMIGHRNERYAAFGGFAARLDDLANLIPARLTGVLLAAASLKPAAFAVMMRDASRHRSLNAGWPEAAIAGGLGVRLSGPRAYGSHVSDEPWLNESASDPSAAQMHAGLRLYRRAMVLGALLLTLATLAAVR